jgi:phosphatidylserine/phosphatidylglycerophosphate/cardiolipin synthase-like enzyme
MKRLKDDILSEAASKALLGIGGEATGQEILNEISGFCETSDFMIYGLLGAGIIKQTAARRRIRDYKFLVNEDKASDIPLIKSLLFGGKGGKGNQEVKLVASFPPGKGFNKAEGLESLYPLLCRLVISANEQIALVNPFFDKEGTKKVMPYLKKASERGVKIRIISRPVHDASKRQERQLKALSNKLGNRCEVRRFGGLIEGKPFYLHAKFMVGDNKMAYVGSANITETSLGNNVEVGVIVGGKNAEALLKFFNIIWEGSSKRS